MAYRYSCVFNDGNSKYFYSQQYHFSNPALLKPWKDLMFKDYMTDNGLKHVNCVTGESRKFQNIYIPLTCQPQLKT